MLFKNRDQIINNGETPKLKEIRREALDILTSALEAVDPYYVVKSRFDGKKIIFGSETIDTSDFKDVYLIGFGKASVGMAQAICDSIEIKKGAVITNYPNNKVKNDRVNTFIGSHPLPDKKSVKGTEKILDIVEKCDKNDLLIVLISGGGSSLLCKPRVNLKDFQHTTDLLLKSGTNIKEINTVRKHLSFVKGGQLAASAKCNILSLIISDIIGDPIEFIASGPTYPDSTTFTDAKKILEKYDIWEKLPPSVRKVVEDGIQNKIPETPKNEDPIFDKVFNFVIANNETACKVAEDKAEELGYKALLLTTKLDGEARDVGRFLVEKATNHLTDAEKMIFISGGETTVTVKGKGIGGRNLEMVLSGVEELADKDVIFLSFATDGIDGTSDAAGAIADAHTLDKALNKNLDPNTFLDDNNSFEFFKSIGDLFITGPTGTNVMDIHLLIKIR